MDKGQLSTKKKRTENTTNLNRPTSSTITMSDSQSFTDNESQFGSQRVYTFMSASQSQEDPFALVRSPIHQSAVDGLLLLSQISDKDSSLALSQYYVDSQTNQDFTKPQEHVRQHQCDPTILTYFKDAHKVTDVFGLLKILYDEYKKKKKSSYWFAINEEIKCLILCRDLDRQNHVVVYLAPEEPLEYPFYSIELQNLFKPKTTSIEKWRYEIHPMHLAQFFTAKDACYQSKHRLKGVAKGTLFAYYKPGTTSKKHLKGCKRKKIKNTNKTSMLSYRFLRLGICLDDIVKSSTGKYSIKALVFEQQASTLLFRVIPQNWIQSIGLTYSKVVPCIFNDCCTCII